MKKNVFLENQNSLFFLIKIMKQKHPYFPGLKNRTDSHVPLKERPFTQSWSILFCYMRTLNSPPHRGVVRQILNVPRKVELIL